jgi:hypothetical protein
VANGDGDVVSAFEALSGDEAADEAAGADDE